MLRKLVSRIEHPLIYKPQLSQWTGDNFYEQEELSLINSKNQKIYFRYKNLDSEYLIIFSHGNAANISGLHERYEFLEKLGFSYITYDYPGYGISEGIPSEEGLFESLDLVFSFAIDKLGVKSENIILFGQSLGGAVTVDLAYRQRVRAAIVESSFQSTHEMSKLIFKHLPIHLLAENKFRSIDKVSKLKSPCLFIHGDKDITIPIIHTEKLYEACSDPKKLYIINNCNHREQISVGGVEYFKTIESFIKNLM